MRAPLAGVEIKQCAVTEARQAEDYPDDLRAHIEVVICEFERRVRQKFAPA